MSTILRINEIAITEGINISALEKSIGASKGVLSRAIKNNTDIQTKWISLIVENYPTYNANWLLTGEGKMTLDSDDTQRFNENLLLYKTKQKPTTKSKVKKSSEIPLVSINSLKNFSSTNFSIPTSSIKALYTIPKFADKKVDFMIEITGDSMLPRYKNGDLLACAIIKDSNFTQWNRPHVIVTKEQGVLVKRLRQSTQEGHLYAVSDNSQYEPFDIPIKEINGIALIVGGIFEE